MLKMLAKFIEEVISTVNEEIQQKNKDDVEIEKEIEEMRQKLFEAVEKDDLTQLEVLWAECGTRFLKRKNVATTMVDKTYHRNLHHHAAFHSNACALAFLCTEAPENVNAIDRYGMTPLMLAAQAGSLPCIRVLVGHGANPFTRSTYNKSGYVGPKRYLIWSDYTCN